MFRSGVFLIGGGGGNGLLLYFALYIVFVCVCVSFSSTNLSHTIVSFSSHESPIPTQKKTQFAKSALMHVMDALVNHGCLVVDSTRYTESSSRCVRYFFRCIIRSSTYRHKALTRSMIMGRPANILVTNKAMKYPTTVGSEFPKISRM